MPRNFSALIPNNPRAAIRFGLGVLLAANLIAAYFVFRPIGGSAQELRNQAAQMRTSLRQQQSTVERTRALASKIERGRAEGDGFMATYFLPRRTAYSIIMGELNYVATKTKVTPRESAFSIEPVEGSDTLEMMQISANYEGTYDDLIHFVNLLDKSDRLLVIEGLNATPQQSGGKLNVMLKVDSFVREGSNL